MSHFYVSSDADVLRCRLALISRMPIAIAGLTESGQAKPFAGIVQSMDQDAHRSRDRRWRVFMNDGK
jgi:hypothetical protein